MLPQVLIVTGAMAAGKYTPRLGLWIDNARLSVEQTVRAILAAPEKTRANI